MKMKKLSKKCPKSSVLIMSKLGYLFCRNLKKSTNVKRVTKRKNKK